MSSANLSRRHFIKMSGILGAGLATGAALAGCAGTGASSTSNVESGEAESSAAGNAELSAAETAGSPESGGKILVAYYSAQGHTRRVAEAAAEELGADLLEIAPVEPYTEDDLDWTDEQSRVSREHDDDSLRDTPLASTVPSNWTDYDTVLVGYPIWWAIAAWPINRFASDNDFSGKRVVPFCTSASSELGQSASLLAEAAGTGNWAEGQRFASGASDDEVRMWARGI